MKYKIYNDITTYEFIDILERSTLANHKIVLLSAPDAKDYYPKVGFKPHQSAWFKKVEL